MKAVYEMTCKCCEAEGKPARTRVEVEGDQISATCESHGPWLWFRPENHAEILAMHRAALAKRECAAP